MARCRKVDRPLEGVLCRCEAESGVVVRVQVGEDQVACSGSGGVLARLLAAEVQARGKIGQVGKTGLAQQDVRRPGQLDEDGRLTGVA